MASALYEADLFSAAAARDAITVRTRFNALKKTTATGILLMLFFGYLGAHRFYAGRTVSGAAMLSITATSLATLGTDYSMVGLLIVGIWGLVDCWKLPQMIAAYNRSLMISLGH
jgi:TM2 domain-containing membrane protein YozV